MGYELIIFVFLATVVRSGIKSLYSCTYTPYDGTCNGTEWCSGENVCALLSGPSSCAFYTCAMYESHINQRSGECRNGMIFKCVDEIEPTLGPTINPTNLPIVVPTGKPTLGPTINATNLPTVSPTKKPTLGPTINPTNLPTVSPTKKPTTSPTKLKSSSSSSSSGMDTGVIVGIVIGAVLIFCLGAIVGAVIYKKSATKL